MEERKRGSSTKELRGHKERLEGKEENGGAFKEGQQAGREAFATFRDTLLRKTQKQRAK